MAERRGESTRNRILESACRVIAEKGYRSATHAEICQRAGANVASINYYFGSKEGLYRAVFDYLDEKSERLYPVDGNLPENATPEDRFRSLVHAHVARMFDPDQMADLHKIRMAEMFDSTGLLDEQLKRRLVEHRKYTAGVLRHLLGPQAAQRDLEWCEMSVMSQCFVAAHGPGKGGPRDLFGLHTGNVEELVDHIVTFSLAGIESVRSRKKSGARVASRPVSSK